MTLCFVDDANSLGTAEAPQVVAIATRRKGSVGRNDFIFLFNGGKRQKPRGVSAPPMNTLATAMAVMCPTDGTVAGLK